MWYIWATCPSTSANPPPHVLVWCQNCAAHFEWFKTKQKSKSVLIRIVASKLKRPMSKLFWFNFSWKIRITLWICNIKVEGALKDTFCLVLNDNQKPLKVKRNDKPQLNLYSFVATSPWILIQLSTASTFIFSLQETYEAKRKEFLLDLQRKEEEMRQMFVNKVKETEAELKEKEKEVRMDDFVKSVFGMMWCVFGWMTVALFPRCLAPREVWAAQTDAPGGKEDSGGEKTGAGGGDERFQSEEGCSWDVDGTGAPRWLAAIQKGQGQEEVSVRVPVSVWK